jgi:hypothetical protein
VRKSSPEAAEAATWCAWRPHRVASSRTLPATLQKQIAAPISASTYFLLIPELGTSDGGQMFDSNVGGLEQNRLSTQTYQRTVPSM